ncbi:MAG: DUF4920 domain-containing protein [Syntrophothermus sp.]
MKKALFTLLIALVTISSVFAAGKKYGKELTLKEKTKISTILADPQKYVGKKVLVEGTVMAVCEKRGCWMELASDKKFQKMKVKVNDGEIVFPLEASGKTALVEGTVYEIKQTQEQAIEAAKHEAEEHGKKFDPASVKGPVTTYQIKGLGAVIN